MITDLRLVWVPGAAQVQASNMFNRYFSAGRRSETLRSLDAEGVASFIKSDSCQVKVDRG